MHATRSETTPLKAASRAVGAVWREALGRAEPRTTPTEARGAKVIVDMAAILSGAQVEIKGDRFWAQAGGQKPGRGLVKKCG